MGSIKRLCTSVLAVLLACSITLTSIDVCALELGENEVVITYEECDYSENDYADYAYAEDVSSSDEYESYEGTSEYEVISEESSDSEAPVEDISLNEEPEGKDSAEAPVSENIHYSVHFDANASNVTGKIKDVNNVSFGNTFALPANQFKRTGYSFVSWNTSADGTGNEYLNKAKVENLSSEDGKVVVLYAQWAPIEYTITYKLNGGVNSEENLAAYTVESEEILLISPSRDGYQFVGWYTDSKLTKSATVIKKASTGNKIFYAKWKANKYNISFDGNGATSGYMKTLKDRAFGTKYSLSENGFKKKGYKFIGWNTEPDGTGTGYVDKEKVKSLTNVLGETVTLYAQWELVSYKITYVLNGGVNAEENLKSYSVESETINLTAPTRAGAEFLGWFSDSKLTKTVTSITAGSTGNKTFYAKWKVYKYNVKFDGNGATSGTMKTLKNKQCGSKYALTQNAYVRNGYTFTGWNTEPDGTGEKYTNKQTVSNLSVTDGTTVILYAQWKAVDYRITYKLNGGINSEENPETYTVESEGIVLSKPVKEGYRFIGWYSDSKYKKTVSEIKQGTTGNKTVYAKWSKCSHTETEKELISEATCVTPCIYRIVCKDCSKVIKDNYEDEGGVDAEAHSYDEGVVTTEPTKTTEGVKTYTCKYCEETKTEPIECLTCENAGHGELTEVVVSETTCTTGKVTKKVCPDCGEQVGEKITGEPLGHTYDEGEVTTEPTKTTEGVKTFTCEYCEVTKTEPIECLTCKEAGHGELTEVVILKATCTTGQVTKKVCPDCGEQVGENITGEPLGHDWNREAEEMKKPTCAEEGYKKYACKNCEEFKEEKIEKTTSHTNGKAVKTKDSTCTEYGEGYVECTICGKIITIKYGLRNHNTEWIVSKEPSENEDGERQAVCTVCNTVVSTEVIYADLSNCKHGPYHGVEYRTRFVSLATCSTPEIREKICLNCSAVIDDNYVTDETLNPTNHVAFNRVVVKEATATETGIARYECTGCNYSYETGIPVTGSTCEHSGELIKVDEADISWNICTQCGAKTTRNGWACLHGGTKKQVVVQETTETQNGIVDLYCSSCDAYLETKTVHAYKTYVVDLGYGETGTVIGYVEDEYNNTVIDGENSYLDENGWSYEVFELENQYRKENGVDELEWNYYLQEAANLRAVEAGYSFSHTRPNGDPWYTANRTYMCGENLGRGHKDPATIMQGWKNSEGHNRNLLHTSFKSVAVGVFHMYTFQAGSAIPTEIMVWAQSFSYIG